MTPDEWAARLLENLRNIQTRPGEVSNEPPGTEHVTTPELAVPGRPAPPIPCEVPGTATPHRLEGDTA